jgi:hypothetical protein
MPESLTRKKTSLIAVRWPASNRYGGRLHLGTVADFKSEARPTSRRYTRPD